MHKYKSPLLDITWSIERKEREREGTGEGEVLASREAGEAEGGKKASISQLTHSFEYHLNTFTGGTWTVRDCTCS
jgi:hypothetical protein